MQPTNAFEKNYRAKAKLVFGLVLLLLAVRFLSNALLSQIGSPAVLFEQTEAVYRLFHKTGLLQFLTGHSYASALFDIVLLFLPLVVILTGERTSIVAFSLFALVYFFAFNIITGHHYHGLVGLLVITIPFWSKEEKRFDFLWDGARYYLLYVFGTAGLWKVLRGSVFYNEQMSNILKAQQLDLLLQQPDSFQSSVVRYLIAHPDVSHIVLIVNVCLQLSFLVGFFTRKFDTALLFLCLTFVTANYFVMSITSTELLILCVTLLSPSQLEKIQKLFVAEEEEAIV